MNITLGWFFNIPGIFITAGVVLIIIALVVFIIANKKEKAGNSDSQQFGINNGTLDNVQQEGIQSGIAVNPVDNVNPVTNDQNVVNAPVNPVNVTPVEQPVVNPINNVDLAKEDSVASLMKSVTVAPTIDTPSVDVNPIPNVSIEPVTVNEPVVENVSVSPVENPLGTEINPVNVVETNDTVPSIEPVMPIESNQEIVTPISNPVDSMNVETPVVEIPNVNNVDTMVNPTPVVPFSNNIQPENVVAPAVNNDVTLTPNVVQAPDVITPVVSENVPPVVDVPSINPVQDSVVSPLEASQVTPVDNGIQQVENNILNPVISPVTEVAPVQDVNPTVQNDTPNNLTEEKKEDIEEI